MKDSFSGLFHGNLIYFDNQKNYFRITYMLILNIVLTTHRLAYLCCQCCASLDMKIALSLVVARNEWCILYPVL